mmetsp:Transcript_89517/g.164145  ORF Transcript_89517/g.164145 Transcript_89517/m.164145 type:complete len:207 (+) Transcript_89517:2-622(+)
MPRLKPAVDFVLILVDLQDSNSSGRSWWKVQGWLTRSWCSLLQCHWQLSTLRSTKLALHGRSLLERGFAQYMRPSVFARRATLSSLYHLDVVLSALLRQASHCRPAMLLLACGCVYQRQDQTCQATGDSHFAPAMTTALWCRLRCRATALRVPSSCLGRPSVDRRCEREEWITAITVLEMSASSILRWSKRSLLSGLVRMDLRSPL